MESTETLEMKVSVGGVITDLPYYDGSYDITPEVAEQQLATQNRAMREDVTVRAIPFEAVSNESGTTITIGGY